MTKDQQSKLQDMKAFIERCIIEDSYETCVLYLAADTSALMSPEQPGKLFTEGEFGKLVLPKGFII